MANAHDYFEYLTDHVDISPANSQEELNAATTIAELMGEHGIEVKTEEFDTASLGRLPYALLLVIIFIGTFIAGIGGLPFAFIGGLLAIGSVAVIILDHLGNNIFENFGPVARSQNVVAVHEAGHALVNRLLLPENRLARVSILPSGHGAAGYNLTIPAERVMVGKRELESQICVLLAGRAAEQVVFGEAALTAGAANDIARATELAAAMVLELGLHGEPAVSVRVLQRQCGGTGDAADGCRALLKRLYDETGEMIGQNIRALDRLAERLLEAEALDGEEAEAVLDAALSNDRRESA